jgi:signal peptidase I
VTYIKRVLGVAGDQFYINPRQNRDQIDDLIRSYDVEPIQRLIENPMWGASFKLVKRKVPAGSLYVIGDNPVHSDDSRAFGPIPIESLTGKVLSAPTPRREFSELARIEQQAPV